MSSEPGVEAAAASAGGDGGGGGGPEQGFDADMAPVDLDQAMGSFSPEWANGTVRRSKVLDQRLYPETQKLLSVRGFGSTRAPSHAECDFFVVFVPLGKKEVTPAASKEVP